MNELYQPKGGMCASCKDFLKNCTSLNFKNMPVIDRYNHNGDDFIIVKCTNFERQK